MQKKMEHAYGGINFATFLPPHIPLSFVSQPGSIQYWQKIVKTWQCKKQKRQHLVSSFSVFILKQKTLPNTHTNVCMHALYMGAIRKMNLSATSSLTFRLQAKYNPVFLWNLLMSSFSRARFLLPQIPYCVKTKMKHSKVM